MLESIGYLDEVNSADNLTSIINPLLFHLKAKWLKVANSIQESGQRPRIHNISKFVSEKSCVNNTPVRFEFVFNNDSLTTKITNTEINKYNNTRKQQKIERK